VNKIPLWLCTRLYSVGGKGLLTCLLLLIFVSPLFAQFTDDFSDGDFTNNPVWTSNTLEYWSIDNFRLRSNSPVPNSAFYISTPSTQVTEAQWEFWVNLQFNTSGLNLVDVYLVSQNENLLAAGNNGYFVRIGGTPDEVSLFRMINGTATILIDGANGVTNTSNTVLRIRVTRDAQHVWTLSYDNTGTGNAYFTEPTATDATITSGSYFGIRIAQSTSTFFNRHFFDDFYVGDIIRDTEPPKLVSVTVLSSTSLEVRFNEDLDEASAGQVSNYQVNNAVGNPLSAILQADKRSVQLQFGNAFPNGLTNTFTVSNVQDAAGNAKSPSVASFVFFQPQPVSYKDIIFSELFPDPSPVISLPEAEFVELFNRSANPVNLAGWRFADPSSSAVLPSYILLPGAYVIITPNSSAPLFSSFGAVLGVSNFPTLNNGGDNLTLRDANNMLIDFVNYTDAWYKDDDKRQGGWTLELIDTENTCAEGDNWVASEDASGGTPGRQNSVKANKPDRTGPMLLSAIPLAGNELKLVFNERLEAAMPPITSFSIAPANDIVSTRFANESLREIILETAEPFQPSVTYSVTVRDIRDCSGNRIQEDYRSVRFGLPQPAESTDIVINELLFNPRPFGVDFIELYNRSSKYINLKDWSIGNFENALAINLRTITSDDLLFPPDSYLAFTTDPFNINANYPKATMNHVIRVNALPAFPDNAGTASVVDRSGTTIDNFSYSRDYHSVFLRDKEGVSLERISATGSSNDPNNWKSASSVIGFATPGYRNSNAFAADIAGGEVNVNPEIFIPLFGQPDFTEIRYKFEQGGRVANVKIVDHQGREIRKLANNELLATEGFFRWDGDRDDGSKARPGYYVVWFEIFDVSGRVETYRKRVVVAARY
jgi:hypothetical protein